MMRMAVLILVLLFPAFWGWLAHWLVIRLWPAERQRPIAWDQPSGETPAREFLDYQI